MLRNLLKNVGKPGTGGTPAATRLNLGCGRKPMEGWMNLDSQPLPGVDVVADLDACASTPLPFPDGTFEAFHASHLLEHLNHPLPFMQEIHRIAKPNAVFEIRVPYGSSDEADIDPTHVRRYFVRSFGYFSQPRYRDFDYGYSGDWEPERVQLVVDGERYTGVGDAEVWEEVNARRNVVAEMRAFLRAVKPARAAGGEPVKFPAIQIIRAGRAPTGPHGNAEG
jgi:SAM-dependent methyltransferase